MAASNHNVERRRKAFDDLIKLGLFLSGYSIRCPRGEALTRLRGVLGFPSDGPYTVHISDALRRMKAAGVIKRTRVALTESGSLSTTELVLLEPLTPSEQARLIGAHRENLLVARVPEADVNFFFSQQF